MKKSKLLLIIIMVCITILSLFIFAACEKNEVDPKGYVVVSFVTNCEIIIEPIILDGSNVFMPDDPIRAGYIFVGWFYDQLFTAPFYLANGFSADTTLYAKWMKKDASTEDGTIPSDKTDEYGFLYSLMESGNYQVTSYKGTEETITIPDAYKNIPIQRIGDRAFKGNTKIKVINFGYEINSIGKEVFRGCTALTAVNPKSGNNYFSFDNGILYNKDKTVIVLACSGIGASLFEVSNIIIDIYQYAFSGTTMDISFAENGKYKYVDGFDFAEAEGKITLGKSIAEIRKDAFFGTKAEIIFAENNTIEVLTNGAFAGYSGEILVLPNSITELSLQPFNGCIATVDLSRTNLNSLGGQAFGSYRGETLIIPLSVTDIGSNCFYQCDSFITFQQGSLLSSVGEQAFNSFMGSVTFQSGITSVEKYAFYCASSAAEIKFLDRQEDIVIDSEAFAGSKAKVSYI